MYLVFPKPIFCFYWFLKPHFREKLKSNSVWLLMTNNLDETNLNSITASVNRRSLFSLRKNKPSEVKFPTIGGGSDKDYNKWEKWRLLWKVIVIVEMIRSEKLENTWKTILWVWFLKTLTTLMQHFRHPSHCMEIQVIWWNVRKINYYPLVSIPSQHGSKAQSRIKMQLEWLKKLKQLLKDVFEPAGISSDSYY